MTNQIKAGLGLAVLLGLADIAIIVPYSTAGSGDDKPPLAVVIISILFGLATIIAVAVYWRSLSRAALLTVFGTRVISGLGDIPGFFQGGVGVAIFEVTLFVLTIVCLWLLWPAVRRDPKRVEIA